MRWYDRLRRSAEIAFVRRRGREVRCGTLYAYGVPGVAGRTRVCVSVSKAVGIAVVRNLVRRRVRGALDQLERPQHDVRVLFIMKPGAASAPYDRVASDVRSAIDQLGSLR